LTVGRRRAARSLGAILVTTALLAGTPACSGDDTAGDDAVGDERPPDTAPPAAGSGGRTDPPTSTSASPATTAAELADALCRGGAPVQIGVLTSPDLDELSGIEVVDRASPVLWAIEDSGNDAALFALDTTGAEIAELDVDGRNIDWEAIAEGRNGTLFIGDIGDNLRARDAVTVYVVTAPSDPASSAVPLTAATITVRYPDGPHDAEALFADPIDGDLYIVTKALDQRTLTFEPESIVYRFAAEPGTEVVAEEVARLRLGDLQLATGADIAADGGTIALRTYASVYVWSRDPGEPVANALTRQPCVLPGPPDRIGEAIAFMPDGSLVTTSEGAEAPVWRVSPGGG
jgi:hypothetical protein